MISKALVQAKSITPEPGGDGRDRTGDLHVANVALSRLSYIPTGNKQLLNRYQIVEIDNLEKS